MVDNSCNAYASGELQLNLLYQRHEVAVDIHPFTAQLFPFIQHLGSLHTVSGEEHVLLQL